MRSQTAAKGSSTQFQVQKIAVSKPHDIIIPTQAVVDAGLQTSSFSFLPVSATTTTATTTAETTTTTASSSKNLLPNSDSATHGLEVEGKQEKMLEVGKPKVSKNTRQPPVSTTAMLGSCVAGSCHVTNTNKTSQQSPKFAEPVGTSRPKINSNRQKEEQQSQTLKCESPKRLGTKELDGDGSTGAEDKSTKVEGRVSETRRSLLNSGMTTRQSIEAQPTEPLEVQTTGLVRTRIQVIIHAMDIYF